MSRPALLIVLAGIGVAMVGLGACQAEGDDQARPSATTPPATSGSGSTQAPASGDALASVDPAARRYVDAVNAGELDALVAAFHPDGVVIDVRRRIEGAAAIRTWADDEVIGGRLQVLESRPRPEGGVRLLVQWAPAGSGGFRAWYTFTVRDGLIAQADLQYA